MKRKIGRLCMVLGAVLILSAAGLLGYNCLLYTSDAADE